MDLSTEQIRYAAMDAWATLQLYLELAERVGARAPADPGVDLSGFLPMHNALSQLQASLPQDPLGQQPGCMVPIGPYAPFPPSVAFAPFVPVIPLATISPFYTPFPSAPPQLN